MTFEEISEKLKSMLTEKKFEHSLAVKDAAVKLAFLNNADVEKASIAGLVHDCAKCFQEEDLLKKAEEFGILIDGVMRKETGLLHGPVGAEIAKREFGIEEAEILDTIRHHTTGCENMSLLGKIVYIADYISEDRKFPEAESLRKAAFEDLNAGVLMGMDITIKYIIAKGRLIHPETIKARNDIIVKNPGIDYKLFI